MVGGNCRATMIPSNTVLVLGAGASQPYKFPTATQLTKLILEEDEDTYLLINMGFTSQSAQEVRGGSNYANGDWSIPRKYRDWLEDRLQAHGVEQYELEWSPSEVSIVGLLLSRCVCC